MFVYLELFYVFFSIGLFTFGGGYAMIPMINNEVINRGWLSEATLTNYIAISEATPGPFAINIATAVGNTIAGPFGGLCATLGVIMPSFIIILLVAFILSKFLKNKYVKAALNGVQPVVISLILSTAILFFIKAIIFCGNQISTDIQFDKISFALFLILGGITIIYKKFQKKNLNPLLILLLAAVLGVIVF